MLFIKAEARLVPLCSGEHRHHAIGEAHVDWIYNQIPSVRVGAEEIWKD